MRIGIAAKLFLAIFFSCLLVMLGMVVAVRANFQHGFLDYVRESNETRVELVASGMARQYVEHGTWDFMRKSPPEYWYLTLRTMGQISDHEAMRRDVRPSMPPPGLRTRLWLLDEQRQIIGGLEAPPADNFSRPVLVGGKTVGWVVSSQPSILTRDADRRFVNEQLSTIWRLAMLAVGVAAIVALVLARGLLAPLKRLTATTHQLSAGDFTVRLPAGSSDEIGQLARDFNQLAEALEKNEHSRRNFMADVSHELRTPLAVLRGELEALEDGVRVATPASIRSLQAEVATLSKLVDDLYQLSLADLGALSYRKADIDLAEPLALALGAFRERLAERRLTVSADLPPEGRAMVFGDSERLTQLFNNLLENSVRYTDPAGDLRIRYQLDGQHITLTFEDSAPGVPDEQLPRLFDRFHRLESSRNRASGGAGLGLAICQSIVEAHGGTLTASHGTLGGLHMAIRLPLRAT
jgi:two-component system sensor histidine kinase BaeS